MRIVVMSDSHGRADRVKQVIEQQPQAELFIFLGDGLRDFRQAMRGLPDAGSVLGVLGASLKREELLRAIGQSLQKRCAQAAAEPQALLQDVSARCITLGRTVKIKTEAGEYTAFAARLDRDGQLICQSEEGEEIKVRAGEVSVRGLNGYL